MKTKILIVLLATLSILLISCQANQSNQITGSKQTRSSGFLPQETEINSAKSTHDDVMLAFLGNHQIKQLLIIK